MASVGESQVVDSTPVYHGVKINEAYAMLQLQQFLLAIGPRQISSNFFIVELHSASASSALRQ